MNYLSGLYQPSAWILLLVTAVIVQITMAGTTLYLHRDQAHRGLDLHPIVRHFFRFWLWVTTGIVTKEWVAVHRKHHARCEVEGDPHSPVVFGLKKVLLEGAELYRDEAKRADTLEKYGRGTPDDWLERNVYDGHSYYGIAICFTTLVVLFGPIGITMGAVVMISQPLFAAGLVNGLGHHSGYRNFECDDAARNLMPWGVLIAGEELHNNHHAFPSSAKFSVRKWEFDIGWLYIRLLMLFGLAKVRRVAPTPKIVPEHKPIDVELLRTVMVSRMHVLRDYGKQVTLPVLRSELKTAGAERLQALRRKARKLLIRQPRLLDESGRRHLAELLDHNQALRTVHEFRERLRELWNGANVSNEKLVTQLKEWCAQAEASGINSLQEFSRRLQGYRLQAAM